MLQSSNCKNRVKVKKTVRFVLGSDHEQTEEDYMSDDVKIEKKKTSYDITGKSHHIPPPPTESTAPILKAKVSNDEKDTDPNNRKGRTTESPKRKNPTVRQGAQHASVKGKEKKNSANVTVKSQDTQTPPTTSTPLTQKRKLPNEGKDVDPNSRKKRPTENPKLKRPIDRTRSSWAQGICVDRSYFWP